MQVRDHHATRALRACLPLIALAAVTTLALSDWPIGWRVWIDHPYLAALAAGLSILFLAGAVVDSHFRRREARRWHGLGFVAAGEFASIHYDTGIAMAALIGADDGYRLRADVEFHLAVARERAAELIAADGEHPPEDGEEFLVNRLALLVSDGVWRGSASQTLRVARSHLLEAVSRWSGTFAILDDDEQFNRVKRTVAIMDLITALHMSLIAFGPPHEAPTLDASMFANFTRHWRSLLDATGVELDFWNARRQMERRVELPALAHEEPADLDPSLSSRA